jgi:uncharacterized protein YegP (UPF0339 family)
MYKLTLYKAPNGEWRWKMVAKNGRLVGASSEGYKKKSAAIKNLEIVTGWSFKLFNKDTFIAESI